MSGMRDGSDDSHDSHDSDDSDVRFRDTDSHATDPDTDDTPAHPAAAAANPVAAAVVGPINEYNIFDVTPTQLQARMTMLQARAMGTATPPLNVDEQFEFEQLNWWDAKRRYEEIEARPGHTEAEIMAANGVINTYANNMRRIDRNKPVWVYSKDYKTAKTKKIADVRGKLKSKLDDSSLLDADKTALLDETVKELTDQDYTLASMQQFLNGVDALQLAAITDKTVAQQQLQVLRGGLVLRTPPVAPPNVNTKTKPKAKASLDLKKWNPFILKSEGAMARMAEAFIKFWVRLFLKIWNSLQSRDSRAAKVTPPAAAVTTPTPPPPAAPIPPHATPIIPPAAPPVTPLTPEELTRLRVLGPRWDQWLLDHRAAATEENVTRQREGREPIDVDISPDARNRLGIPPKYEIGDFARLIAQNDRDIAAHAAYTAAAAAPATLPPGLVTPPPPPAVPLSRIPPSSAITPPLGAPPSSHMSPTSIESRWPGRPAAVALRNSFGRVGSPITHLKNAAKRIGFFAERRAQLTLSAEPRQQENVPTNNAL